MIFLNCLLFSTLVPIISVFGCLYFLIKYLVDKNNLLFVYSKTYESGGHIRKCVKHYLFFNLVLYLIVMASFYGLKFDEVFKWVGPVIVLCWCVFFAYFKY